MTTPAIMSPTVASGMPLTAIPFSGVEMGKAAALLWLLQDSPQATIIVSNRCNYDCAECLSPRGTDDIEPELAKEAIDDLRGLPDLYFSGGEPFLYKELPSLVRHAGERVGAVHVITNGGFLPSDEAEARDLLSQFPPNTIFTLSADIYHWQAHAKRGKSLADIFKKLYDATSALKLGLELFVRIPDKATLEETLEETNSLDELVQETGMDAQRFSELQRQGKVHMHHVSRQNSARSLPWNDARPVSIFNFEAHEKHLLGAGISVTPTGLVTDNPHAAYLHSLPAFTVLGDLHSSPLYEIIRDKLVPGHHLKKKRIKELLDKSTTGASPFTTDELQQIAFAARAGERKITQAEVDAAALDPNIGIDWDLVTQRPTVRRLFSQEDIERAIEPVIDDFIKILTGNVGAAATFSTTFFFYIQNGKLAIKPYLPSSNNYPETAFSIALPQILSLLDDFRNPLRRIYDALMKDRQHFKDHPEPSFSLELLFALRMLFKDEISRGEALKEWFWFKSIDRFDMNRRLIASMLEMTLMFQGKKARS